MSAARDAKFDAWYLAKALGDTLVRKYCDERAGQRRKSGHPGYGKGKREDAILKFAVAVVNGGETIEIRCASDEVAAWKPLAEWHERLVDVEGYVPVMAVVRVVGYGKVR